MGAFSDTSATLDPLQFQLYINYGNFMHECKSYATEYILSLTGWKILSL